MPKILKAACFTEKRVMKADLVVYMKVTVDISAWRHSGFKLINLPVK